MFDEPHEGAGQALLDFLPQPGVAVVLSQRRRCPNCVDSVMMRRFSSVRRSVMLDECPTCGAIWLDPGELRSLRSEYPSEQARRQAAREYFHQVFGERLEARKKEREERVARAERIRNVLLFLWPFGDQSETTVDDKERDG